MTFLEVTLMIITILLFFNILLAVVVVFFERRNPASTWAWLMVLLFIPVIGFFIYLFFGQDVRKQQIFMRKCKEDKAILECYLDENPVVKAEIENQISAFKSGKSIIRKDYYDIPNIRNFEDLANMHITSNGTRVTYNNSVKLFHDGKEKFVALEEDIRAAKSYIHLEYYIIKNDRLGKILIDLLTEKAKQGVEVKLIYDSMGGRSLSKNFFKPLIEAGGQTGIYFKSAIGKASVRLNYRNHRKIAIIDGKVGYIGGFNIGEEYLGITRKFGYWRDTHARLEGDCIDELELRFIMDWNFVANEAIIHSKKYFPLRTNPLGVSIQIVSSGPDSTHNQIQNGYFKMINEAEKYIYIVTPYFVPDDSILEAIRVAALAGLDVRILLPGKPDHPFVYSANLSYAGELINSGVRFFHYDKAAFVHSKLLMVDGVVCSIGTANMDVRSFKVNFEVNAFIYDKEVTKELEQEFLNDLSHSKEITIEDYKNRSIKDKFGESVARLISPIL
jgi:cardiolipin synthase